MKLNSIPKINKKRSKRLGRGQSSGKGKTSGRGTKGQKARGKLSITHPHFEGGARSLIKRLPYKRGKGNSKISKKPLVINLDVLSLLPASVSIINLETLIKSGIVDKDDAKRYGVKILGNGSPARSFTIDLPISKSAAAKIIKAGGKVPKENQKPLPENKSQKSEAKAKAQ